jgi:hypothetical protein
MCVNNAAAIKAILNTQVHPRQELSIHFCQAVSEYLKADKKNTVTIYWALGHQGIYGNKLADKEAKAAACQIPEDLFQTSYAFICCTAKEKALSACQAQWHTENKCNAH